MTADPAGEPRPRAVILVEGTSDQVALEVLARRRGRDLAAEGVALLAMDGVTNLGHYLRRFAAAGPDVRLAVLCDAAERGYVERTLRSADGGGAAPTESAGYFVCTADLEDELIRALGVPAVERIIEAEGELRSLHTLRRQPAQRGRCASDQLRRFVSGRSGNKQRYARLFAQAIELSRVPPPLDGVLGAVLRRPGRG